MDVQETLQGLRDRLTADQVFGPVVERDGVTLVPVAAVRGGGGGGGGGDAKGEVEGSGVGFGLVAQPVGAWVIRGGEVSWQPALDVNRIIVGGQVVAVAALLLARRALKRRRRRG
jgi:uncharacterized spore protein YtfJ